MMMGTFQVSDLARKRTAVIEAARTDCAVIRDKDQDLVMLKKADCRILKNISNGLCV